MDELIDAYLDHSLERIYYLDMRDGAVVMQGDYNREERIDWDDEESEERYYGLPKIDSGEGYEVMEKFAKYTDSDPHMKLFDALEGHKPFRNFRDMVHLLGIREEWNAFERAYAEDVILGWIKELEVVDAATMKRWGIRKKYSLAPKRKTAAKKKRAQNMPLPDEEVHAILRAADDLIAQGGRSLLAKVLKGSRDKKLLEHGLESNPSYGFYRNLTLEQITDKIDHMIRTDFIRTEQFGKLPLIEFTPRGWVVERERRAEEFLREWDHWLERGITPISMEYLKERNRGMIFLFLFKILTTGDKKYIPFLRLWEKTDFRKVQAEIRQVIEELNRRDELGDVEWMQLLQERARTLIVREKAPVFLACEECDQPFIFYDWDLSQYTKDGIRFPDKCPRCDGSLEVGRYE